MIFNKGDIYLINFDPVKSGEIGKLRPGIILSDNQDATLFKTVVVVPLSSLVVKNNMPYRYLISQRGALKKDSDACVYEIRSLAKSRLKNKIADITTGELNDIRQALCDLL